MELLQISAKYRDRVNEILKEEWHCPPSVSKGKSIDTTVLPGFLFVENDLIKGVVTYNIDDGECEIVTLNSFDENKGIGSGLINAVLEVAKEENCKRVWLITTNDSTDAIRFYQIKGFDWVAAHINAIEKAREIKPDIPFAGAYGIPIKHELEFEIRL